MSKRVLIEGYQPSRSGGSWEVIKPGRRLGGAETTVVRGNEKRPPAGGPTENEKLPKTNSSVQIPKR